jgi:hypothetical protein
LLVHLALEYPFRLAAVEIGDLTLSASQ